MFTLMDKRDDDALLNAYNLVRERLERNKAESGRLEDAVQQTGSYVLAIRQIGWGWYRYPEKLK